MIGGSQVDRTEVLSQEVCTELKVDEKNIDINNKKMNVVVSEESIGENLEEEKGKNQNSNCIASATENENSMVCAISEKEVSSDNKPQKSSSTTAPDLQSFGGDNKRLLRLRHLVEKTSIYSKFLFDRMKEQQAKQQESRIRSEAKAEKKRKEKLEKEKNKPEQRTSSRRTATKNFVEQTNTNTSSNRGRKPSKKDTAAKPTVNSTVAEDLALIYDEKDPGKSKSDNDETTTKATKGDEPDTELVDRFHRTINGESVSDRQPKLVVGGVMRSYQLTGLEWLVSLYENGLNGILGDEMGLGKTLQCISFIAHLVEKGVMGPFLICAPLSTISNWVSEFEKFTPSIPVVLYHGDPSERAKLRAEKLNMKRSVQRISYQENSLDDDDEFEESNNGSKSRKRKSKVKNGTKRSKNVFSCLPVVVTSYEIVMRDRKEFQNVQWQYIIVDEGHRIKNLNCRLIKELKSYNSVNRLLLTGTPLQNSLSELWSLLNFLLPDIFDDLGAFQSWFDFDNQQGEDKVFLEQDSEKWLLGQLHNILEPFLLRRLKQDVEFIIPSKKELVVYTNMSSLQQTMYKESLLGKFREYMASLDTNGKLKETDEKSGTEKENEKNIAPKTKTQKTLRRRSESSSVYKDKSDREFFRNAQNGVNTDRKDSSGLACTSVVTKKDSNGKLPETSQRNVKLQNLLMHLRKICNHPYLIDYPLTPTGDFKIDEELIKNSGKLMMLDRLLPALKERGHRVLIFSQMTEMLNILQDYCWLRDYRFCRLDGSVNQVERQAQIAEFQKDEDIFLFMLSTRAGGLGINLTSADTVIIFDSDWNPQCDLQAQDRCHRIGQKKPVLIYRFCTDKTVELTMLNRARAKRRLEKAVVHAGKFKGKKREISESITSEELNHLVADTAQVVVVSNPSEVISDKELEYVLDRSEESMNQQARSKANVIRSDETETKENLDLNDNESSITRRFDVLDVVPTHQDFVKEEK